MAYGGGHGGRTRMGTKVQLNLYDISPANDVLYTLGFGLHHSGVVILGQEYSFASGGGIFESPPGEAPGAKFRETLDMGTFEGGSAEVRIAIDDLRRSYGPTDYNLIRKNCNHFANALVWALLRRQIPPHINRLADVGNCFSCLLPRQWLEDSPVGPNAGGGGGDGSGGGFQVYRGSRAKDGGAAGASSSSAPTAAFIGRGAKLGSASGDESGGGGSGSGGGGMFGLGGGGGSATKGGKEDDPLTDRREKARQAALARLERNAAEGT